MTTKSYKCTCICTTLPSMYIITDGYRSKAAQTFSRLFHLLSRNIRCTRSAFFDSFVNMLHTPIITTHIYSTFIDRLRGTNKLHMYVTVSASSSTSCQNSHTITSSFNYIINGVSRYTR